MGFIHCLYFGIVDARSLPYDISDECLLLAVEAFYWDAWYPVRVNINGLDIRLSISSIVQCAQPICFDCKHLSDPDACKSFVDCSDGQHCYKEVVETDAGTAEYNWGCASKELCTLENGIGGRRKRLGIERCFECCTDNFCNFGPCIKDYCVSIKCQNGGSCNNTALKGVCDCMVGYTGRLCETEIDECVSDPCQHGGVCKDNIGSFQCTCQQGYTGNMCEIDIDECASSPCNPNGGTCIDGVNMFTCACAPGYTGTLCEIDVDECLQGLCQYNSTCIDLVNDYTCSCPAGITGRDCQINIDDCVSVTCQNGGTCVDYINGFQCMCKLGFSDQFCETSLGQVCYNCDDIDNVDNCTNEVICGMGEECFMEHELVSPGNYNYNLGCVPTAMCAILGNGPPKATVGTSRVPFTPTTTDAPFTTTTEPPATTEDQTTMMTTSEMNQVQIGRRSNEAQVGRRSTRPIQLCYECCDMYGCNHHACADSRGLILP